MNEPTEPDPDWCSAGWYKVAEARRFIPALVRNGVNFRFSTSTAGIKGLNPVFADKGGSFGSGAQVLLEVHRDDHERFHELHREILGGDP
jgi:hypothetical protein